MPLNDKQFERFDQLSSKSALSDDELNELASLEQQAAGQADPSLGQVAAGLGVELGAGVAAQATAAPAAAAVGAALAPVPPLAAVGSAATWGTITFGGGFAGSIAAQKLEGRENVSYGRAIMAGLINMIPGSTAAKATKGSVALGKAIGGEALRGAAIAGTEAIGTQVIDEGEVRIADVMERTALGAGAGAVLGVAFKGGRTVFEKLRNKTPAQIDEMVAKGEILPSELSPAGVSPEANATARVMQETLEEAQQAAAEAPAKQSAMQDPSSLLFKGKNIWENIVASVAPSKMVGREVQDEAINFKNNVLATKELSSIIAKRVDEVVAKQNDPAGTTRAIEAFVNRKTDSLPEAVSDLRGDLLLAREKIADLQAKLLRNIDIGATEAAPELRDIISRSMDEGNYLTREYQFFTNKDYSPTPAQREAAITELSNSKLLASEGKVDIETARKWATEHINELDSMKLSKVQNRNFLPSAIDGFMRERTEPGPALRSYLGEIENIGERLGGTMSRLARGVYRDSADSAIAANLERMGLATRQPGVELNELSLRGYKRGGTGLYVKPEVQRAINLMYAGDAAGASSNVVLNALADGWNTAVGLSKASKVLMNPPSYAVQLYGNTFNLMAMGINPLRGAGRGMRIALSDFGNIRDLTTNPNARRALLSEIEEATRYGIKSANVLASDVRSNIERGVFSDILQKVLEPLSKAYSAADTAGRFVAWKANQKMLRKVFPEASDENIKAFAASITNDTYQNYDRLSNTAKTLSRWGIVPQFASFTMEFVRNQYNQARIINELLTGRLGAGRNMGQANRAEMMKYGMQRMAASAFVYGTTYGAVQAWNASHGVTPDKYEALKRTALPDYDEHRQLAIKLNADGLTGKYANPSYVIPHAIGMSAFEAGISGQPVDRVKKLLLAEFVGEGSFPMRSLFGAKTNADPDTQSRISKQTNDTKKFWELVFWGIEDAFQPGILREVEKYNRSIRGQGKLSTVEVGLRQLGARFNDFDVKESASFKIGDSVENAKLAAGEYTSFRDSKKHGPEAVEQMWQKANGARMDALAKVVTHVKDLRTLGVDDDGIVAILRDNRVGMGTKDILNTLEGRIDELPKVKRHTSTDEWDKIATLPRAEQLKAISSMARSNPQMATQLRERLVLDQRQQALGVSTIDRLIGNLGSGDGERAEYIWRKAQESGNPEDYIRGMTKRGLVTPEVMRQINLRRRDQ